MSFEFKPFSKKEATPVERESNEAQIIANIIQKLKTEGINQTDVRKQPHELNPGQIRHEVHNDPRQLEKPEYNPNISPDSVIHPKPPATA